MSAALRLPAMTGDEYLAWEARQEGKHEFDGFAPVAMNGVRLAHAAIQSNLIAGLHARLRGQPCRVYGSDLKVKAGRSYRYPDVLVVCTPVPPRATVVTEPVVVFEILSESTAVTDLVTKNAEYRGIPSLRRYVVLRQDEVAAVVFQDRDGGWMDAQLAGMDAVLDLPEIGVSIPLSELYEGFSFEEPGSASPA